jgi:hypothetical protein
MSRRLLGESFTVFSNLTALARGASVGTVVSTEMKRTLMIFRIYEMEMFVNIVVIGVKLLYIIPTVTNCAFHLLKKRNL